MLGVPMCSQSDIGRYGSYKLLQHLEPPGSLGVVGVAIGVGVRVGVGYGLGVGVGSEVR